jgi:hypothetical protein
MTAIAPCPVVIAPDGELRAPCTTLQTQPNRNKHGRVRRSHVTLCMHT